MQLVYTTATPTSSELGTQGRALHDSKQLTFLCLSLAQGSACSTFLLPTETHQQPLCGINKNNGRGAQISEHLSLALLKSLFIFHYLVEVSDLVACEQ